jgi:hypothetical protein
MLNSTSSGCALPFAPPAHPTGAPDLTALAAALHGLLGLRLPLLGGCLGGRKVRFSGRHVQLDPEPGGRHQSREAGVPAQRWLLLSVLGLWPILADPR